ncbi:MAG: HNH endonuclease [Cyanobacteriota bacterium]|jgi:uncharacterized protein (TIGR02646 family)
MRPIRRGESPRQADFSNYRDALPDLASRLGQYCSYCERRIPTQLAVEHIQPKGLPAYQALQGRWENFLLACVNCNSNKGDNDVILNDVLLPDRDNTFAAFLYDASGRIRVSAQLRTTAQQQARATLSLVGLDRESQDIADANGRLIALDRIKQRVEAWLQAVHARDEVLALRPGDAVLAEAIVRLALATGFFSVWMEVFRADPSMRHRLINAFPGTRASGCFDPQSTDPVQPAPNPDRLPHGGKA